MPAKICVATSRILTLIVVGLLALPSSGCQMGRKWFQMDSNSQTPYFGLELTPRSTSLVVPSTKSEGAPRVDGKAFADLTKGQSSPTAESAPIKLPRISLFPAGERAEDVSLTGPQSVFSR